jgi:hypothetical protein
MSRKCSMPVILTSRYRSILCPIIYSINWRWAPKTDICFLKNFQLRFGWHFLVGNVLGVCVWCMEGLGCFSGYIVFLVILLICFFGWLLG